MQQGAAQESATNHYFGPLPKAEEKTSPVHHLLFVAAIPLTQMLFIFRIHP
jgi:hypothetical protein